TFDIASLLLQQLQRNRADLSCRFADCTISLELAFTQRIEQHLTQDAARGIAGTQHQRVVLLLTHFTFLIYGFNTSFLPAQRRQLDPLHSSFPSGTPPCYSSPRNSRRNR